MAENNRKISEKVFQTLIQTLDNMEWHYRKNEVDLSVDFTVSGDDLSMRFNITVDAARQMIDVDTKMGFTVPPRKESDIAVACCVATYGLPEGCFIFNPGSKEIKFRNNTSFKNTEVSEELISGMIHYACFWVDKYNDRFYDIICDKEDISDFVMQESPQ